MADLGPSLSSSAASRRRLLHVQRSGDIGSPRVSGRPARSDHRANRGPFRQRLRPPPGRRTPPSQGAPSIPSGRAIVLAAMRVTRETAAMPPCPAALADAAKSRRRHRRQYRGMRTRRRENKKKRKRKREKANDTDAVAAGAFHSINGHSHGMAPVSVMSSSCSCGSARCSIMFVSMSRTWESGML